MEVILIVYMWEMWRGMKIDYLSVLFALNVLAGTIKEGTVTDDKLLDLARDVVKFWKNLGRELQIPEARLDEIDIDYQGQGVVEKAYQMLLSWRDKCYPSNTFRCIYDVLSNQRLNCRELAIKHCC